MLIKSFLAIPKAESLANLADYITGLKHCEVTTPQNKKDVLVVVMEHKNQAAEDLTISRLKQAQHLDHMVLVSSFNEAN